LERNPYSDTPFTPRIINIIYDGIAKFRTGNYEKAIERFDYVIEEWPEYRLPYFLRGVSQAQLQKYEKAIKDFRFLIDKLEEYNKEKVIPIYLNPAELYYLIAFAYLKQENLDKAEETFKKVIMENMGFYMAHYQLSNIWKKRKNYAEALKELDATIIAKPDDPIFHFSRGVCLTTMDRNWEAMQEFMKAISLNPNYPKSYYTLAVVLESIKNNEAAVENYQNFIERAPKQLNTFIEKAKKRIDSLQKEQTLQEN
jgi:tetratricopeptide (TPR) repeat protein